MNRDKVASIGAAPPQSRSTGKPAAMEQGSLKSVAACHCGTVRIHVRQLPRTLTRCNCSICRRYGAIWAYYKPSSVRIDAPRGALSKYAWNRKVRDYHRCAHCGCVTHYTYRGKQRNSTLGVNAANFEPSALVDARIRHLDGAASWKFLD